MRELSFVKKITFEFNGSVTKRALVIGDADNDMYNELVCANLLGELAIFKDKSPCKYALASDLGMITACTIGDAMDLKRNTVIAINMEGWLFIFDLSIADHSPNTTSLKDESSIPVQAHSSDDNKTDIIQTMNQVRKISAFYEQRMPANCKEILLADLDGDGQNELIIGLTDRVLRTYKWFKIDGERGKFVGIYKWEFADQIGSVSLNPSRRARCMDIIVAQPGGTYARLECFDKKPVLTSTSSTSTSGGTSSNDQSRKFFSSSAEKSHNLGQESPTVDGDECVKTEYINKLTPEYHQLAISQMRNHHISTEVLGGISSGRGLNSYNSLVIATLDGTLMLVNKDEILWSLQVDHQLFALAVINQRVGSPSYQKQSIEIPTREVKNDDEVEIESSESELCDSGVAQYFVACAWNGKTYLIDEERNYLRFQFDEAVSAFTAGTYYFDGEDHSVLVYATFNNQIDLYYDVVSEDIRPKFMIDQIMNNPNYSDIRGKLESLSLGLMADGDDINSVNGNAGFIRDLVREILYGFTDDDLSQ